MTGQHGRPVAVDACHAQPAGGVGRRRESEGLVLPWKPGNAGGGKEPWFWVLVTEAEGQGDWHAPYNPHQRSGRFNAKLYVKAKTEPTFRFYRLYDKVYRADILAHAYALAKANGGAPGVDGETFEQIESAGPGGTGWRGYGKTCVRAGINPAAVRRVYIPKVGGVGERPLGIPTIRDRVVQTAAVLMLSPIFEAGFTDAMYGYRPRRSAQQAVAAVHEALGAGYTEWGRPPSFLGHGLKENPMSPGGGGMVRSRGVKGAGSAATEGARRADRSRRRRGGDGVGGLGAGTTVEREPENGMWCCGCCVASRSTRFRVKSVWRSIAWRGGRPGRWPVSSWV